MWCQISPPAAGATSPGRLSPPGFTLIELIIAISLLGTILTLVYGSFGQIAGSARQEAQHLADKQELRLLLNMVASDLQAAQYLQEAVKLGRASGFNAETQQLEGADFTTVHLHAALPARFHSDVPAAKDPLVHELGYLVRLAERGEGEGLVLVRREDFYVDEDLTEGGVSVVVIDRITNFKVEFLEPPDSKTSTDESWELAWDSADKPKYPLPVALRITLGRSDSSGSPRLETMEMNLQGALELKL